MRSCRLSQSVCWTTSPLDPGLPRQEVIQHLHNACIRHEEELSRISEAPDLRSCQHLVVEVTQEHLVSVTGAVRSCKGRESQYDR